MVSSTYICNGVDEAMNSLELGTTPLLKHNSCRRILDCCAERCIDDAEEEAGVCPILLYTP
jgi:hypothetical protein